MVKKDIQEARSSSSDMNKKFCTYCRGKKGSHHHGDLCGKCLKNKMGIKSDVPVDTNI